MTHLFRSILMGTLLISCCASLIAQAPADLQAENARIQSLWMQKKFAEAATILEARAAFEREISVVAARGWDGTIRTFPISQNHHVNGILSTSLAPAEVTPDLALKAHDIARRVLEGLGYVGVLAVEMFVLPGGELLLNEIAPRVHNSGHWTQDGCLCDQFEQHIRAVAGWPLGDTSARCTVEMTNLLGPDILKWPELVTEPNARLYVYGKDFSLKDGPRPGRKMGHINRIRS